MLSKAATVTSIRRDKSNEYKRSNTLGGGGGSEKIKDPNLRLDYLSQKIFWSGVSYASMIQKESLKNIKNNRFQNLKIVEKVVVNNSKEV